MNNPCFSIAFFDTPLAGFQIGGGDECVSLDASLVFASFWGSHKFRVAYCPPPPFTRGKSVRRVVKWHDQQVSSKISNITRMYQLIDELTWLHGKNNVM